MQIDDVSPTTGIFAGSLGREDQCVSGRSICVAMSPDGNRAYVGGHSGVWRSDDGGASWTHPEWRPGTTGGATRPGALLPPNVYDLVVHPVYADVVFAAASDDVREPPYDGVYRSTDGALTWALAYRFQSPTGTIGFVGCIAMAPDNPDVIYAAGSSAIAISHDGGVTWTETLPPDVPTFAQVTHVAVAPATAAGRRVYATGDHFWYSSDGGATFQLDPGGPSIAAPGAAHTASARTMAIHPQDDHIVYLMRGDLTLVKGVYPDDGSAAVWTTLPPPPIAGGTDSGCAFVIPVITDAGVVLYVSDRRSVHACLADPAATENYSLVDFSVHVDPHGIAFSADFHGWGPDYSPPTFGRAILVNDGGAMFTTDGIQTWQQGTGLSTLNAANVAINSVPGTPVAITYGGGDDFGFTTPDDGAHWFTQDYLGGDNDCAFADPHQPTRMVVFAPRAGSPVAGDIFLYVSPDTNAPTESPPNTAVGTTTRRTIPGPVTTKADGTAVRGWNAVSNYVNAGYRPLVLTRHGETPRPDGDLVTIRWTGVPEASPAVLLRTTSISSVTSPDAWVTTATAEGPGVVVFQVGPTLPDNGIGVVQPSGGHDAPTFFIGTANHFSNNDGRVWRLDPGSSAWHPIVPAAAAGTGPAIAYRFFVDPYRPQRIYVLADDSVYRSNDGGNTWIADASLDAALTENGAFPRGNLVSPNPGEIVLRDMQFDPVDPNYRIALGSAGVFLTQDGVTWSALLRSSAVSLQPTSMIYDPMGCERALYVGTMGRGILRLRPLPPDWDFPVGSLQAAVGHITLLRVHDLGTGYGPPYDFIDAEIIVWLDTEPGKAFGLQLRNDGNGPAAAGMLDLLRDCFNHGRPVRLDFTRSGCRTGTIIRVFESFS